MRDHEVRPSTWSRDPRVGDMARRGGGQRGPLGRAARAAGGRCCSARGGRTRRWHDDHRQGGRGRGAGPAKSSEYRDQRASSSGAAAGLLLSGPHSRSRHRGTRGAVLGASFLGGKSTSRARTLGVSSAIRSCRERPREVPWSGTRGDGRWRHEVLLVEGTGVRRRSVVASGRRCTAVLGDVDPRRSIVPVETHEQMKNPRIDLQPCR